MESESIISEIFSLCYWTVFPYEPMCNFVTSCLGHLETRRVIRVFHMLMHFITYYPFKNSMVNMTTNLIRKILEFGGNYQTHSGKHRYFKHLILT